MGKWGRNKPFKSFNSNHVPQVFDVQSNPVVTPNIPLSGSIDIAVTHALQ